MCVYLNQLEFITIAASTPHFQTMCMLHKCIRVTKILPPPWSVEWLSKYMLSRSSGYPSAPLRISLLKTTPTPFILIASIQVT